MSIPAISVIRVSGDGQDEDSQRGSCERAAKREGLEIIREIPLHAVSGYKGEKKHLAAMANVLAAVRAGEAKAVVVAHSSRAARLPHRDVVRWQWDVEDAGGRFVSDDEASWAKGQTVMDDAWNIITAGENHKKSEDISSHVNRQFRKQDGEGWFRGYPPSGYRIEGERRQKYLVPAAERYTIGEVRNRTVLSADEVKEAFKDAAGDVSTTALGRKFGMSADAMRRIIHDPLYSTGRFETLSHRDCDRDAPCRVNNKRVSRKGPGSRCRKEVHRCEPLVTVAQQRAAIAGLERRYSGDNVTSRALTKDDFSGALYCPFCGPEKASGMTRTGASHKPKKDGSPGARTRRYQCRKCLRGVIADAADAAVNEFMLARNLVWFEPVWVEADNTAADDLERVEKELEDLSKRGLDDDAEDAERARLRAERTRLRPLAANAVTGHWGAQRTAVTEGGKWRRMSTSQRRAWMVSGEFRIYVRAAGFRTGKIDVELEYLKAPELRRENVVPLPPDAVVKLAV